MQRSEQQQERESNKRGRKRRRALCLEENMIIYQTYTYLICIFSISNLVSSWVLPTSPCNSPHQARGHFSKQSDLFAQQLAEEGTTNANQKVSSALLQRLEGLISETDRGRSCTSEQAQRVEECLLDLEKEGSMSEPARSPLVEGYWIVQYTTVPPPSNGQLGPFRGISSQQVNSSGDYVNMLKVPPNDWLSATLEATWKEWDGRPLVKDGNVVDEEEKEEDNKTDFGATCWVVSFNVFTIRLFGRQVFRKVFEDPIRRIWRTTYVDENIRILRAGRTGQPQDEYPFYMTRGN